MWTRLTSYILGPQAPEKLPQRVRKTLKLQQRDSEVLISWVQLGLVLFFGVLYGIAPKTLGSTHFSLVPWALTSYALFTLIRLIVAHRGFLPYWLLQTSVVVDIILLMVLIWSFHIQYNQPASFYLKAPTLLYVFIFIALRSLRFEPRFVLFTGLAAALGWTILLIFALTDSSIPTPFMDRITRDYVLYMTSNQVLIGAEIDKIISILLVTIILGVAVERARRLLSWSAIHGVLAKDLSRFVPPEVAERIASSDTAIEPGQGEQRFATVMFTDIEGFSTISEQVGVDVLFEALNDYFQALSNIVDRHQGVISMFQGDAMMVTYNTVHPVSNHAELAIQTAIAIQQLTHITLFGQKIVFKTRCGINTGKLMAGAVGSSDRMIYTPIGDEVNVAARLEQLNKKYGSYILVSAESIKACEQDFPFRYRDSVRVKGRENLTTVYSVEI